MKHRVKRFVGAISIYTLGVILIASVSYLQERQRFLAEIDKRLFAAASNIPSILPDDFHDIARDKDSISDEQDQFNLELMTRHTHSGDLTYLYTYVMVDGMIYFTSCNYTQDDIDNDQVVTYWTDYPEGAQEYFDAMEASEPVYVTAGDRWGLFRTILMPMTSPSGLPYVAAADMDITVIERSLMRSVLSVFGMSLLLLAIAIPLILAYRRTYFEMNTELRVLNRQLQSDIDQALILEAELKQATHEANAANDIKSQFLSNMSHELRTPINGISGMNELLLDTELTEEQEEYIDLCNKSADVLLETVNQILDVAAIEAGGLEIHAQAVKTEDFFEDIVSLFSAQIAEKHLDLVLHLNRDLPAEIKVDPLQLRKVLINLISNAIKFTEHGSVKVFLSWKDGVLRGEVQDTGMGVPNADKERIFEAFQQADNSYARVHGGTGLGLPISRQICNMMEGDLFLHHSDERGSTFKFRVKVRACNNLVIPAVNIPQGQSICVCSESTVLPDWLVSEFVGSRIESVTSIQDITPILDQHALILIDASFQVEKWALMADLIDQDKQSLIWMAWAGQQLPEELLHKVRLIRKPLTRASLSSICASFPTNS